MYDDGGALVSFLDAIKTEYPFEGQFFELPAGKLHYLDEGPKDAPVVLMVHGNPTWSFYYRRLVRALSPTHRVIAPDHLGCGLSDKPQDFSYRLRDHIDNLLALIAHLELKDITLVVHDWGGAIGMGAAGFKPALFRRFVIFNTAAFTSSDMPWSIALARLPGLGPVSIRGLNMFAKVALQRCLVRPAALSPEIREGYLGPYGNWHDRIAHLRFVEDIPMGPSHPSYGTLSEVEQNLAQFREHPMLICWGAQDFVFNDHFYEDWQRFFPKATRHYLKDASHYVLEEAHEAIIPWVKDFLKEAEDHGA